MVIKMSNIPLNIDYQQIFLHLLNFVLLFAIMYFLLYKPVKDFMAKRQAEYEETDKKAAELLKAAEEKNIEYTKKLEGAEAEINELRLKAHKKVSEDSEKSIRHANEEAEKIVRNARETAENERRKILEASNADIQSLVMDAAEKLAVSTDAGAAFDEFLSAAARGNGNE